MRWSIRSQLLVPLLTLLLSVVIGITTWSAVVAVRRERQQIETQLRSVAHRLSTATYDLHAPSVLGQIQGLSGAEYVVVQKDGGSANTLGLDLTERPAFDRIEDDPQALSLGSPVMVAGKRYLGGGLRIKQEGKNKGSVVYILYPESLWRDALREALVPPLVLGAFGGLASVLLAAGLAHRLSQRIQQLERHTRQIAAGDFRAMPLPGRNDELRDLGASVNDMAEQLARLQDAVKQTERLRLLGQVSGGLAHQLRNGVTGARLAVQLHARECNDATDTEALDVALRQLQLVETNLKRFLDLGKADEPQCQPCSLTALVSEAVALLQPQCRHAHTELRWQPGEDIQVSADSGQLEHLVHNVLGNAIEAAGPEGWVEVTTRCEQKDKSDRAVVEVIDSGPGPAPEVAARLFEPFVTGKREGIGLGLAVARRVAEAHGGSISWRRDDDRTCFRIELPMKEDQDKIVS